YDINVGGHHRGSPPGGFFAPYKNPQMENGPDGESLTLRLADETSRFIRDHQSEPFFAMLSFYAVHAPVQTTETLWQKYQAKASGDVSDRFIIDRTLPVRQVQDHPVYAGMMETLDKAVGKVMDQLEASGLSDSTIVIFTGDNGGVSSGDAYATCNLPLRGGKGRQWEGGIREPFYIRYPNGADEGITSDVPVTGADLFPTVLELCGLDAMPDQHVDGVSLVPLLNSRTIEPRPLYWHYPHYGNQGGEPNAIVRIGNEKLIHYYEDGRNELYDLESDPGEQNDLAAAKPERAAAMWKQLDQWLTEANATRPLRDPRFDAEKDKQRWQRIHTTNKQRLERNHANYLDPNWKPNPTWWGSQLTED
ncbi:MAG: sulfatase-like hydrolase/transferase, partial [Planctomycetota bacterium]